MLIISLISFWTSLVIAQEINPIYGQLLDPRGFHETSLYQDQLFIFDNLESYLFQYNLSDFQMIQNRTFGGPYTMGALAVIQNYIFLAYYPGANALYQLNLNNLQGPFQTFYALNEGQAFDYDDATGFLIVGTSIGIEKFNMKTLQRIESVNFGLSAVSTVMIHGQSVFVGGNLVVPKYFDVQERNLSALSQLIFGYDGHHDVTVSLAMDGYYLFTGSYDYTVKQWDTINKSLFRSYNNHTSFIFSITIHDGYLFSCSDDTFWIQWDIQTGLVYRKVSTGKRMYSVVIYSPYLITTGNAGLFKFTIPEFGSTVIELALTTSSPVSSTLKEVVNLKTSTFDVSSIQTHMVSTQVLNDSLTFSEPKLSQQQKTTQVTKPFLSNVNTNSFIYYLLAGSAIIFLLLIICTVILYRYYQKKKKKLLETSSSMTTTTSTTNHSLYTTSSGSGKESSSTSSDSYPDTSFFSEMSHIEATSTTMSFMETMNTLIVTKNVFSIPGFLLLNKKDIQVIKQIAKGGQGVILIGKFAREDLVQKYKAKEIVIKSMSVNFDQLNERQKNVFNLELAIIYYFKDQPGFVRLYGYTLEPSAIILKYYPLGSLEKLIQRKEQFKTLTTTKRFHFTFLLKISKSILLMHSAGFVHSDIKPQNILIEMDQQKRLNPVFTDFGITQIVSDKVLQVRAMNVEHLKGFSIRYAAPEQISQLREKKFKPLLPEIVKRRDIYAFAGLIYGLMMTNEPWHK